MVPYEQWEWSADESEDVIEYEPDWIPMKVNEIFRSYLLLGLYWSIALLLTLGELLFSQETETYRIKKYCLVFCGLLTCLYVTCFNLFIFGLNSFTNDFKIDWRSAGSGKWKAYAILAFGAVTSVLFFIGCLVKYFGILNPYE